MVVSTQWDTSKPIVYIQSGCQTSKMMINALHQLAIHAIDF